MFGLLDNLDFSVDFAKKNQDNTYESKCFKVASKIAEFGKAGFKFKIAFVFDYQKESQCLQNGLKFVLLFNHF